MCQKCRSCGTKLAHRDNLSVRVKKKLKIKRPEDYEYCCICPNLCPDQRPDGHDVCEMCCDCA